jgi:hypothetical protein
MQAHAKREERKALARQREEDARKAQALALKRQRERDAQAWERYLQASRQGELREKAAHRAYLEQRKRTLALRCLAGATGIAGAWAIAAWLAG